MILRLLAASFRRRSGQLALIVAAVASAAATVAVVAGFAARAGAGLGGELAAFGANLTVRPQVGGPAALPAAEVDRVRALPGVVSATPVPAEGEAGVAEIEVRADPARLAAVAAAVEAAVPGAEARPILRVSESEAALGRRLTWILAAVAGVSCLLAAITVGAATAALVDLRRTEYGLFLALGFTGRRTAGIFAAELLSAAVVAALLGALGGELAAGFLAGRLLAGGGEAGASALSWAGGLAAAGAAALLLVGGSMLFALRRVERLEPARVLRGE